MPRLKLGRGGFMTSNSNRRGYVRKTARVMSYPVLFVAGWIFNFVADIQYVSGFLSGWFAHSWLSQLF